MGDPADRSADHSVEELAVEELAVEELAVEELGGELSHMMRDTHATFPGT